MPRRRPAELRARPPIGQRPGRTTRQVSRVSAPTLRAIAELERTRLLPGAIAGALAGWAQFVHGPARDLGKLDPWACSCGPVGHRGVLHLALQALPATAARELRTLVRPLDEHYLARAIPDPATAAFRGLLTAPTNA